MRRREFLACLAAAPVMATRRGDPPPERHLFEISLAQWSLHRMLRTGELDNLEFPTFSRREFRIEAVEYVNTFFQDKAGDRAYLDELDRRAEGVKHLLIMVDREGDLGHPDDGERKRAVENHYRWVEAARHLGCHSIRVNARSQGTPPQQRDLASDGLRRLVEFAEPHAINVIVENHGGLSSNGTWLASVIKQVGHTRCGTLPDFGNFHLGDGTMYDRYQGVRELMPFAKAVSAKSNDFDEQGNEVHTDFSRMMRIVLDAGYHGHVGIEYEGDRLNEIEGVKATKRLLERVREGMERMRE